MLHAWGKPDPRAFGWYEPPPEATLAAAERLLAMLGALTGETNGEITPLGRRLMSLPVHPRLARLLLAAAEAGRLEQGAALAALLSEKDIAWEDRPDCRRGSGRRRRGADSDLLIRLDLLAQAERRDSLHTCATRGSTPRPPGRWRRCGTICCGSRGGGRRGDRRQGDKETRRPEDRETWGRGDAGTTGGAARGSVRARPHSASPPLPVSLYPELPCLYFHRPRTTRVLLQAPPPRLPRSRLPAAGVRPGGGGDGRRGGVRLAAESVVAARRILPRPRRPRRTNAVQRARRSCASPARSKPSGWRNCFPAGVRRERAVVVRRPQRSGVAGVDRTWYRDLLLREDANVGVDPAQAAAALAVAMRPCAERTARRRRVGRRPPRPRRPAPPAHAGAAVARLRRRRTGRGARRSVRRASEASTSCAARRSRRC